MRTEHSEKTDGEIIDSRNRRDFGYIKTRTLLNALNAENADTCLELSGGWQDR